MMLRSWQNCLSLLGALAINVCVLSAASPALAADDDAAIQMARERFKEGVQFFDQKQYDKARAAFLQAYALKKHPAVLLNLAQSEIRSGHEADGAKHFAQYLRDEKNPTPAERQAAESGLQAAKAAILEVSVQTDVEEADVYVDGNLEGKTPLPGPIYLTPGTHNVELRKGERTVTERVTGSAGQSTSVSLALRPKTKPGVSEAEVEAATPPAEDEDDGEAEPQTEPAPEIDNGPGRKPFLKWLVTTPEGLVGVGLTAVGLGGGIGFAIAAQQSYQSADSVARIIESTAADDGKGTASDGVCQDPAQWLRGVGYPQDAIEGRAEEYQQACNTYANNVDSGDTMKTLSIVSWVVAGAAATGTVVYYFVSSPKDERASTGNQGFSAALVPVLGPTERGLSVVGSF